MVVWSYPRGSVLSKEGETAMDVVAMRRRSRLNSAPISSRSNFQPRILNRLRPRRCMNRTRFRSKTLAERVKHVVQSSFDGRRIVIFSGGAKSEDKNVFEEARAIRDGGGFGSIIGRNSFQRPKAEAIKFLHTIMGIYSGEIQ